MSLRKQEDKKKYQNPDPRQRPGAQEERIDLRISRSEQRRNKRKETYFIESHELRRVDKIESSKRKTRIDTNRGNLRLSLQGCIDRKSSNTHGSNKIVKPNAREKPSQLRRLVNRSRPSSTHGENQSKISVQGHSFRKERKSDFKSTRKNSRNDDRKRKSSTSTSAHRPTKRPRKNPFIFYNDRLTRLFSNEPSEIIMQLLKDQEDLSQYLKSNEMSKKSVEELLEILSKLYDTPYTRNFARIFAAFKDTAFLKHLQRYILGLQFSAQDRVRKEENLERIVQFFNEMMKLFPNICEDLPLDVLFNTDIDQWETNDASSNIDVKNNTSIVVPKNRIKMLGNENVMINEHHSPMNTSNLNPSPNDDRRKQIKDSIARLKSLREDILRQKHMPLVKNTPPDDYKNIPVFPRREDIFPENPPYLRENIVSGRYTDVTHYLDVQFRLLREDYIAPLREGVLEAIGVQADRSRSIHVYRNVNVIGWFLDTKSGGILHRVQFDVSRMRRVNWKHSKRFKYGSLYCLIDSNTRSNMYFVTITNDRNPKDLASGFLNVKFFDEKLGESIHAEQQFFMIESPAYFESYRHVLEGLQSFNESNLPFQRYLVECTTKVRPPVYLVDNASRSNRYDLRKALGCDTAKSVSVLKLNAWPSPSYVSLNHSQYNALKAALTQEFVVVQGPPGTGKTFVGLRIANALLKNKSCWRRRRSATEHEIRNDRGKHSPMLVVCYTNHALDQFLEGILQITENVVRVGGRGKSEHLKRFNLKERKRLTEQSVQWRNLKRSLKSVLDEIKEERSIVEAADKELLHEKVESILDEEEKEQLEQWERIAHQMQVHRLDAWLKMEDEEYDGNRIKRKRLRSTSMENNRKKCSSPDKKRLRDTFEPDLIYEGTNSSIPEKLNSREEDNKRKESWSIPDFGCLSSTIETELLKQTSCLNQSEGDLPESDGEVFFQGNDTCAIGMDVSFLVADNSKQMKQHAFGYTINKSKENIIIENNDSKMIQGTHLTGGKRVNFASSWSAKNSGDDNAKQETIVSTKDRVTAIDTHYDVERKGEKKTDSLGYDYSCIFIEDIEEGEIIDTDDDMSDDDNTSKDGDDEKDVIDLTLIVERQIGRIRGDKSFETAQDSEKKTMLREAQVDLKRLSVGERANLYKAWVERYFMFHKEKLECLRQSHKDILRELSEIESIQNERILKDVSVIGMTTTGAAKHRLTLQEIKPRIVIVEEAAEILEGHVITALSSGTEHLILIGDHKQLKPNPTVYELARKYNLDVSLFERMVKNGLTCHTLNIQHRMRPEIADIMRIIYPNLVDDVSVQDYGFIKGIQHNVYFIDHDKPESVNNELKSHSNEHEVQYVAALCRYLLLQGYESSRITVLTMYTGQLLKLQKSIPKETGIRISSVDNYQGEESDVIILSLVRSNTTGQIGFLNVSNRVCVALSRAKKAMYCIGNISMMAKKNNLWYNIKDHLQRKSMIGKSLPLCCPKHPEKKIDASSAEDFKKAPQGGCMSPCEFRLNCGHVCSLPCHPVDSEHKNYRCTEKCLEELCDLGHVCERACHFGAPCPPCEKIVPHTVPSCKHALEIECHMRNNIQCPLPCEKELQCGHQCPGKCGEDCAKLKCQTKITRKLECGHEVSTTCSIEAKFHDCSEPCKELLDCGHKCPGDCTKCHKGTFHVKCENLCKRLLVCSHSCEEPCTRNCPPCIKECENRCMHSRCHKSCGEPCIPCRMLCMWKCEHHKCTKRCFEMCNRKKCNEPCRKTLKCGHQCAGICGDYCPRLCRVCDKEKLQTIFLGNEDKPDALYIELVDCKHTFEVTDLDYWMEQMEENEDSAVQLKVCPKCKTAIRRSLRYGNVIKKTLADVEKVKEIKLMEHRQLHQKRSQLRQRIEEITRKYPNLKNDLRFRVEALHVDEDAYNTLENKLHFFTYLEDVHEKFFTGPADDSFASWSPELVTRKQRILRLFNHRTLLTTQEMKDILDNIDFFTLTCQFQHLLWRIERERKSPMLSEDLRSSIDRAKEIMSRQNNAIDTVLGITHDERAVVASVIEEVSRKVGVTSLTPEEHTSIVEALNLPKGHWYKCRNGHVYVITECGGAMVTRKCLECNEMIGGRQHTLAEGNEVATEMDGAKYPAWSNETNLQNYDPADLRRLQR